MRDTVIVGGARTAFGKYGGVFKDVKAVELGAAALKGAIQRAGVDTGQMDGVIMGMAIQAGAGQLPSRQAARLAGLDWSVPTETVNKVCASGFRAITLADQIIRSGDAEMIAAGGMESMSGAPYAAAFARWGIRMGDSRLADLMIGDGLQCPFAGVHMAVYGSRAAAESGIGRDEQDAWALRSHRRAVSAVRQGKLAEEMVSVMVNGAVVCTDECPRDDTDLGKLGKLVPVFDANGTITAGNAPPVNDGAAALILMSKQAALRGGHKPLARIVGHAAASAEASGIAAAPALAIRKLLQKTGFSLADIDLFEVNEAFAAVVLICGSMLGWDAGKVNVNGGAIAIGHPIGASGARIVLTLVHELMRRGGGLGIAAICSGGGQGDAIMIRVDG